MAHRGGTTKDTNFTKRGFGRTRAQRTVTRFGSAAGLPRNDTDDHGKEGV
jgi:hypothetical protein